VKVYVPRATNLSRAMTRVEQALLANLPLGLTAVPRREDADLVVFHVVGFPDTLEALAQLRPGQAYALLQYCLRSTQRPSTASWRPLWERAAVVWSYYDLAALCAEDGTQAVGLPFYHAPLGANPNVFSLRGPKTEPSRWRIMTSGYVAETEGVREAAEASRQLGLKQFHLGPDLALGPHVTHRLGISDDLLAQTYRSCDYVAALRRVEGFELPAVEGLLCGARPIAFDRPHYRAWFGDWAEYVPEADPETVTAALREILAKDPRPVTENEREAAAARFSWGSAARGFWQAVEARA
jgi:glycosyltransferase involved in cell wall biosynthesis